LSLKIIADESVDFRIVKKLRDEGFDTISVLEEYRGISDSKVIDIVQNFKAFLLTEDSDFGEWVFAHKKKINSVIFLRYPPSNINDIFDSLLKVLIKHNKKLMGKFVAITPKKIRMRDIIK